MAWSEWRVDQVYSIGGDGRDRLIIEQEFAANASQALAGLQKLGMLKARGWPAALTDWHYNRGSKTERRIEKVDDGPPPIFLLKCKPSCWRIYFHVTEEKPPEAKVALHKGTPQPRYAGSFLVLRVVCKRQQKRDPGDITDARGRLSRWRAGQLRSKRLPLPGDPGG
jgi:hypothetical protein